MNDKTYFFHLYEIVSLLNKEFSFPTALRKAIEKMKGLLGLEMCWIWLVEKKFNRSPHFPYLLLLSILISLSNCQQHLPTKEAALIQAYLATDYQVYPTPSKTLHIRINQKNEELDQFLAGHQSWAYITAWNPNSKLLPPAENTQRNQALENLLQQKGYTYYLGKGVPDEGDWIPEASFLVVDLPQKTALAIGHTYGQKAIVWGQVGKKAGLLFCATQ